MLTSTWRKGNSPFNCVVASSIIVTCWFGNGRQVLGAKPDGGETAGNNLSHPVIWAEGVTKPLRGDPAPPETPILNGEWWYWWGEEGESPNVVPLACAPDPDNPLLCNDGIPNQAAGPAPGDGWVKSYLQKDIGNVWQAGTLDWASEKAEKLSVSRIDWGDNLESVDWYTKSQVPSPNRSGFIP